MATFLIILLVLALLFGGLGFTAHVFWNVAMIVLAVWFIFFIVDRLPRR